MDEPFRLPVHRALVPAIDHAIAAGRARVVGRNADSPLLLRRAEENRAAAQMWLAKVRV